LKKKVAACFRRPLALAGRCLGWLAMAFAGWPQVPWLAGRGWLAVAMAGWPKLPWLAGRGKPCTVTSNICTVPSNI